MFVWKKQLENNKVISPSDKGDSVVSVHFILSAYCWPTLWQKILHANFKGERKKSMLQLTWTCSVFSLWPKSFSGLLFFHSSLIDFLFSRYNQEDYHKNTPNTAMVPQLNWKWKMSHYFWWVFPFRKTILIKSFRA